DACSGGRVERIGIPFPKMDYNTWARPRTDRPYPSSGASLAGPGSHPMRMTRVIGLTSAGAIALLVVAAELGAPKRLPAFWTEPVTGRSSTRTDPGTFIRGPPPDEALREPQEVLHAVRLTRPYFLARHEVTQAEWTRVMGSNPSEFQPCQTCP